jgi:hypothetical protein
MKDEERARILAEVEKEVARANRNIAAMEESLRQRGLTEEELRVRVEAAFQKDPDMRRRLDEAKAQLKREAEQSEKHKGFYAAAPSRRKAPRSTV